MPEVAVHLRARQSACRPQDRARHALLALGAPGLWRGTTNHKENHTRSWQNWKTEDKKRLLRTKQGKAASLQHMTVVRTTAPREGSARLQVGATACSKCGEERTSRIGVQTNWLSRKEWKEPITDRLSLKEPLKGTLEKILERLEVEGW